jgi:hypothetical protein
VPFIFVALFANYLFNFCSIAAAHAAMSVRKTSIAREASMA